MYVSCTRIIKIWFHSLLYVCSVVHNHPIMYRIIGISCRILTNFIWHILSCIRLYCIRSSNYVHNFWIITSYITQRENCEGIMQLYTELLEKLVTSHRDSWKGSSTMKHEYSTEFPVYVTFVPQLWFPDWTGKTFPA